MTKQYDQTAIPLNHYYADKKQHIYRPKRYPIKKKVNATLLVHWNNKKILDPTFVFPKDFIIIYHPYCLNKIVLKITRTFLQNRNTFFIFF